MRLGLVAMTALALGACAREPVVGTPAPGGRTATAAMRTAGGADAGRATVTEVAGGLRFTVDARAVPPGRHAVQVHTTGRCDPPAFDTAGTGIVDLPYLLVGADGRGTLGITVPGLAMDGVLDADGAAVVLHRVDLRADPTAREGVRFACGVFQPG